MSLRRNKVNAHSLSKKSTKNNKYLQTVGVHDAPLGLAHKVVGRVSVGDVEVGPHAAPGWLGPLEGWHPGLVVVHGLQRMPDLLLHLQVKAER